MMHAFNKNIVELDVRTHTVFVHGSTNKLQLSSRDPVQYNVPFLAFALLLPLF